MKKVLKLKLIVVLLVVLLLAMLISVLTLNDNVSNNITAYALSEDESVVLTLTDDCLGYQALAKNRQITIARIPETYNGLPVTEIADSGFANCANLTEVRIPQTVKRIGNNAFVNCRKLETINGMPYVESIGNNAFAMCTKLENLILPSTITELGRTILRSNRNTVYSRKSELEMAELNDEWVGEETPVVYGNELVLTKVTYDGVDGYSVRMSQNINTSVDFVLGDTYKGQPLLEIERDAFAYSMFNSFTLKHGEIISDADRATVENFDDYYYEETDCDEVVNIASNAFESLITNYIDLLVKVTFNDSKITGNKYLEYEQGHSIEVFANSTARSITLPNNITFLPRSMFNECYNLREIKNTDPHVDVNHLSSNITTISTYVFQGCTAMLNLYIPNCVTTMGNSVFSKWGSEDVQQTIHFPDMYEAPVEQEGYNWHTGWQGITSENVKVQYKTISVVFDKEGGKEGIGTNGVLAMYNQEMPEAISPEREHYNFGGYFTQRNGKGTQYYDEDMASVINWDKKEATVLYAYWVPHTFNVILDKNGGTGGSDDVIASYEQPMPSAIKPTKTGFDFLGYYLDNEPYYDENMNSINNWGFAENGKTLTARWSKREYQAILNEQENVSHVITVKYDEPMPSQNIPIRLGYEFKGYFTQPNGQCEQYYDKDMASVRTWDIDSEDSVNLYADWIQKSYTITFHYNDGTDRVEELRGIHYGDAFPSSEYKPSKIGYAFKGYQAESGEIYYNNEMKPTQVIYNVDGNLDLYADLEIINYSITYDLNGGINNPNNPTSATINEHKTLFEPTNAPLAFLYWSYNGEEISDNLDELIEILDEYITEITLRAIWTDTHIVNVYGSFDHDDVSMPKVKIYMLAPFSNNCTINVASTTESIEIYGNGRTYNMNIVIASRNKELSMQLNNITLKSHTDSPAIQVLSSQTLNLYTYKNVNIYGMTQSNDSGGVAIKCNRLIIKSAENLLINGGNGKNGDNGFNGENGGNAGAGVEGNVSIQCSNVTISAGTAGNGGNSILNTTQVNVGLKGLGGSGAKAVIGRLITSTGIVNVVIIDSENGKDGEGNSYITPGHPGLDPDIPIPVPNPGPVIPPITPPIIIKK